MRRSASFWLHVSMSGLLLFVVAMYAAFPVARQLGFRDWSQMAQDLYIAIFMMSVVLGSAGAIVGGSFCYSLSRQR